MAKTILICGHGPGISDAVAQKFGAAGFSVGIVARSADKLAAAAKALEGKGIEAKAYAGDLSDAAAVKTIVEKAHADLGPIAVVHWNAYGGDAGDLLEGAPTDVKLPFDIAVTGLIAATQAAHADLKAEKGAILVTGGSLSTYSPEVDAMAVQWKAMGLAIAKASQHKTVGLLSARLKDEGIYVGEVVVAGIVKGTAFDRDGTSKLTSSSIADKFFELYTARTTVSVTVS